MWRVTGQHDPPGVVYGEDLISALYLSAADRPSGCAAFDRSEGTGFKELGGSPGSDQGGIEIRNSARCA